MIAENSFGIIALLLATAFLPLLAVTVTAFAKISIVIFIVRNALGIQNLPPNIILYSLSLILSIYIAAPVLADAYAVFEERNFELVTLRDWEEAGAAAAEPLRAFLLKHTDMEQMAFFERAAVSIWGERLSSSIEPGSLATLIPSFLISELTKAFQIGFLLYLPFMAIDLIITTILVALGMMMVPPTTISIPFKLMLFVFLDGWTKIVQGLILSYV